MDNHQPLVSIVIAAYNAKQFIQRAIDSCLAQTYANTEIILVDDGSSDGMAALVQAQYGDKVQIIRQENQGVAIARNTGITMAQGDYIKPFDADDILHPTYLEKVMQRFSEVDEHVALVYTRHRRIEGGIITTFTTPLLEGDLFCHFLETGKVHGMMPSAVTIRRDALLDVGMFPTNPDLMYIDDWDTLLRLSARYTIAAVPEILVDYIWHGENMSGKSYNIASALLAGYTAVKNYERRSFCMDDVQIDERIAGYHHKIAMVLWRMNKRREARNYLVKAIEIDSKASYLRWCYIYLSYIVPHRAIVWFDTIIKRRTFVTRNMIDA